MSVFIYDDYKKFVKDWLKSRGKGAKAELARSLKLHPTVLSQILGGVRFFTPAQALSFGKFVRLSAIESEYFYFLVERARAETSEEQGILTRRLENLRRENAAADTANITETLTPEQRETFYSSWQYSAVRLSTFLPETRTPARIARALGLSEPSVQSILDFLVQTGLCVKTVDGEYRYGKRKTLLKGFSPDLARHHFNWRMQALERMPRSSEGDLHYTIPMAIGEEQAQIIREALVELLRKVDAEIELAQPDRVVCLNLDWFRI